MTYLVERLAELRRHLDHLKGLRPRVSAQALAADLSLHNDVLFSLLMVCQLVIDLAGELSARRGISFEDYRQAVRNLAEMSLVGPDPQPVQARGAAAEVTGVAFPENGGRKQRKEDRLGLELVN